MKITDIKVYPISGLFGDRQNTFIGYVFVVVETDEGVTGIGECSTPDPRWSAE